MPVYVGANSRASVYVGAADTDSFYLGGDTFFPLWTPAALTTPALVIFDPATFTWNATTGAFTSGTNTGSLGGTYATMTGTPAKAAADLNGFDTATFGGAAGIKLPSVTTATGNRTLFYISKRLGNPPSGLGSIMTQSATSPGWSFFDEINVSVTPTGGLPVVPGDVGAIGWSAANTTVTKTVVAHPPTDDGTYHINIGKIGTAHLWRYDGTALTTSATDLAQTGVTTDLTIGNSAVNQYFNGRVGYGLLTTDLAAGEDEKLEGWGAWKYGLASKIASGHKFKSMAPTMDRFDFERLADSGLLVPRRRLIVPDRGWKLAA